MKPAQRDVMTTEGSVFVNCFAFNSRQSLEEVCSGKEKPMRWQRNTTSWSGQKNMGTPTKGLVARL